MKMTKQLFVSILALLLMGFYGAPLQAQNASQGSGADAKNMKSQMEQMHAQVEEMRTQMDQIQTLMKDNMAKMAAADAAMKSQMETEQANMKSQMELQQAIINQLQAMTDHMKAILPAGEDVGALEGSAARPTKQATNGAAAHGAP